MHAHLNLILWIGFYVCKKIQIKILINLKNNKSTISAFTVLTCFKLGVIALVPMPIVWKQSMTYNVNNNIETHQ